jgi:hypothetical protein
LTYQVENIPENKSYEQAKKLFTFPDSKAVVVRSLAPALGSHEELRTATIEFKELIPGRTSAGPTLPNEGNILGIYVDSWFNGFTPLNEAHFLI